MLGHFFCAWISPRATTVFFTMVIASFVGSLRTFADPPITAAAFTPDGTGVLIGSQAGVRLLHWPELTPNGGLETRLENIHHIAFSPDGQRLLVAGGTPGELGSMELFSLPDASLLKTISHHTDVVYEASWSRDGNNLVTASADGFCRVIEAETGNVRSLFAGHSKAVLTAIFLDDEQCVSGSVDQTIRLWKISDGSLTRTLNNHVHTINKLALQPNVSGKPTDLLASISEDRTVRLWQPRIGRLVKFAKLPQEPRDVVWSPDRNTLYVATSDGCVQVLDTTTMMITATHATSVGRIHVLLLDPHRQLLFGAGQTQFVSLAVQ
jgi:WD40 repeat protein